MEVLDFIFGLNEENLSAGHIAARATLVFILSFFYLRIAGLRTMGRQNVIDYLTLLIIGSILGGAIVGRGPFFPSLLAAFIIVGLNRLVSYISFHSDLAGKILKSRRTLVVEDGKFLKKKAGPIHVTERDIKEALRLEGQEPDISKVESAYMERSGEISLMMKKGES